MRRKWSENYLSSYYYANLGVESIPELQMVIEEFRKEAQQTRHPSWYVKNAHLYFIYNGESYRVCGNELACKDAVFEILTDSLVDRLYELGAHDFYYTGMID